MFTHLKHPVYNQECAMFTFLFCVYKLLYNLVIIQVNKNNVLINGNTNCLTENQYDYITY